MSDGENGFRAINAAIKRADAVGTPYVAVTSDTLAVITALARLAADYAGIRDHPMPGANGKPLSEDERRLVTSTLLGSLDALMSYDGGPQANDNPLLSMTPAGSA